MLRVYDEFLEDTVILTLHDRSYRLHMSALIHCSRNLTDGEVTYRTTKMLQILLGFNVRRFVAELVAAELWVPITAGHQIRNYLEFNPSAETVKAERAQTRDRMRKLREKRARDGARAPAHSPERDGAVPVLTGPFQSFTKPKAVSFGERTAQDFSIEEAS